MAEERMDVDDPKRPNALWIKGVDNFSTDDIKKYLKKYTEEFFKIEWINDTSLNAVFEEDTHAKDALKAITLNKETEVDDLIEREAMKYDESNPDSKFETRISRWDDKKVKNAAMYSRYYLFNPKSEKEARPRRSSGGYRDRESRAVKKRIDDGDDLFPDLIYKDKRPLARREDPPSRPVDSEDLLSGIRPAHNTNISEDAKSSISLQDRVEIAVKQAETPELTKGSLFNRIG